MAKDKAGMTPAPRKTTTQKPAATKKVAGKAAPARAKVQTKKQPTIAERIEAFGIEAVCERLANGVTMTAIAEEIGVTVGKLSQWIASDEEHSARAREARIHAARIWDEKALSVIEQALDPFELQRAKELAHHYRWRASKTAPKEYGDKLQAELTGAGGGAIQVASTVTFVLPPQRDEDD